MPRARIDPTVGAGDLDKRVTLLQPVYSDSFQDEITGYQAVADVWAGVDPESGMEMDASGRTVEVSGVAIVIRWRADIDARWRIQDHEHTYRILGLADVARRRVHLSLNCQEVE